MPYEVWVAELSDGAAERVEADRPNLWVGITSKTPSAKFRELVSSGRDHAVARFGERVRADLCEQIPQFEVRSEAEDTRRDLIRELRRLGHTVNRNPTRYSVYVVLLDPAHAPDPSRTWVYVGQTSLPPEERFAQHKAGTRNARGRLYNRKVRDHGVGLLPRLVEHLPAIYVVEDALSWEAAMAESLRADGYQVEGGT